MDEHRAERMAQALREELEELINYEMEDPRISSVSVTEVLVTPDRKKAHVRIRMHGNRQEQQETLAALEKARGYLRTQVGERVQLYRVPDFHFSADVDAEVREKADKLLKRIQKGRPRDAGEKTSPGSTAAKKSTRN
jgi:ribosome-binding factor A